STLVAHEAQSIPPTRYFSFRAMAFIETCLPSWPRPDVGPLVTGASRGISMNLSIGDLARRTGVKVPTIRYYEQIGLLPSPPRTAGGQRRYGEDELKRLDFIRHARDLAFDIEDIRQLLA